MATVYDFRGLTSIDDLSRLAEGIILDTLKLPNSLGRARTLAYLINTATMLMQKGDLERRVTELEAALESPDLRAV